MSSLAISLLILYCIGHSYWNFLVKKSENPSIMIVLIALGSWIIPFPIAVYYVFLSFPPIEAWIYILINGILQIFYFALLGRAYKRADMSIVYPLARGTAVFFIPIWGILFMGESLSNLAIIGIILIISGTFIISLYPLFNSKFSVSNNVLIAIFLSILVGLNISFYTIIDKRAVDLVSPFIYTILITVGGSIGAIFFMSTEDKFRDLRNFFYINHRAVIIGSLVMYVSYSLMLYALKISKMSYAGTARELTIVVGLIWSYFLLKETITRHRLFAIILIFFGAISISLA